MDPLAAVQHIYIYICVKWVQCGKLAFSQGNGALFWSKIGHFRRFGTLKIRRDFRGVGREMAAAKWQQANCAKKVRKRTAKNCQKQTAQKVRKRVQNAKTVENKRKQASKCENDWGPFC